MPEDVVVRRKLKRNISDMTGLKSSEEAVEELVSVLNDTAYDLVLAAAREAREDERKTLLLRDVEEAHEQLLRLASPEAREFSRRVAELSSEYLLRFSQALVRKTEDLGPEEPDRG